VFSLHFSLSSASMSSWHSPWMWSGNSCLVCRDYAAAFLTPLVAIAGCVLSRSSQKMLWLPKIHAIHICSSTCYVVISTILVYIHVEGCF
jgi:hypothetical protein